MSVNPVKLVKRFFRKKKEHEVFTQSPNEEIFNFIYENNKWGDGDTRSGRGSNFDRTRKLRDGLPEILKKLGVRSLLDIPCGDFFWMKEIDLGIEKYIGADIVASLIELNSRSYGSDLRQFMHLDLLHDSLPEADAILCKDCLVHMSFADAKQAIENIKTSGSKFLLTTHFPEFQFNVDILTGKHRPLNFCKAPFEWPAPLEEIIEYRTGPKNGIKHLSVWRVADLP
ncbi:MAG TPA: hypothetical protein DCM64_02005 [Gammaproteobacteria bacterium]|jgi:hypothetical protein|nr:class I SAM-dependent methyltransferase [Gammaproteobacteria bacterium]MDP6733537.1 class I SAM-dependent methyltransferase [Gammaproteobacteria bacterium]HAJ75206.1 hypothetical protein [Gammaproteobacteria bacterium]|tara:strand:- start:713 stop:1393 length:681 start_codon:yes stop_codon:yes gene_type:complete